MSVRNVTIAFAFAVILVSRAVAPAAELPPAGSYTIVVVPDTQVLAQDYPQHYDTAMQWIKDNRTSHNIQYVLHEGDIVNNNSQIFQWDNALDSMSILDGFVPYAIAPGNHDYGPGGNSSNRISAFNQSNYFGPGSAYATQPSIGGFFEEGSKTDNSYHTYTAGGRDWLVLALEFGPRDEVVAWANQVMENHPDHTGILLTHAYMYSDETRYDWATKGSSQSWNPHAYGVASAQGETVNDGQELWDKLVSKQNFAFTLNGHVLNDGAARLTSVGEDGQVVHQLLANYQQFTQGGQGQIRLMEFLDDGRTVNVRTYNPVLDTYNTAPDQQFTLKLYNSPIPATHAEAVLSNNPILYYQLGEAVGPAVPNLAPGQSSLNGTYAGPGPTTAMFDGGSQVETSSALTTMNEWTIASWVWTSDVGGNQTIFSNDRLGWNDDVLFGLSPDAGSTAATRWGVTHHDNDTQLRTMVESPVAAEPYQWYHVAASSDGDLLRLYVNGELVGESPAAGADLSFDGALARAGRSFNPNENGRPFYGEISELAVFDHALSDEDLEIQYLTGADRSPPPLPPQEPRHGVSVAHVHVTGTDNASTVATVLRQSPGDTIEAGQNSAPNIGDITLTSGPSEQQFYQSTGVLIANASTLAIPGSHVNPRAFIEAPGELTNFESFSNGRGVWMSLTDISGSGSEANFDFTFAYFPFADGWVGGHVSGAGTIVGGNAESVTVVNTGMGQHLLSIDGVNSLQDGMLFTIGARNGTSGNTVVTGPTTGGSGWEIRVEDQGSDFPTPESSNGEAEPFSFVYVPLDADNLIGGRVSTGGTRYFWAGDFQLTSLAPHQALITIPGKTDEDGILLLTVNEIASKDGVFGPDDIFLVYEYSDALGGFIVDARDLTGASAEANAIFSFAFVEFDNPLRLSGAPGDANFDGAVDRRDLVVLARNYGRVGTALHSDGDFDVNWNVELKDLAILQRDWGVAVGNSPVATVPEPSAGLMAIVSLGFLSAVSRRRR